MKLKITFPVIAMILCVQSFVLAHAMPDRSQPKAGEEIPKSPREVVIWFDDHVTEGSKIEVYDAADHQIDEKNSHIDQKDKSKVSVTLQKDLRGKFSVRWQAICEDGHKTTGKFSFTVQPSD